MTVRRQIIPTVWAGAAVALLAALTDGSARGAGQEGPRALIEPPSLAAQVAGGTLPPVSARVPREPLVVDMTPKGREPGRYGGSLRTLIPKARDIRLMVTYGYARLVGYTPGLKLKPDLLRAVDVTQDRVFTFHLRRGHRWSDGHPFTTEDFRYYWEDVTGNSDLTPSGPPVFMLVDGKPPKVEVIDEVTIRYSWDKPNPRFLPALAEARPPFIYRPAHYLKKFHAKYTNPEQLQPLVDRERVQSWAALHNRYDNMARYDNVALPSLQPWILVTEPPAMRFIFKRNPYYHRIDTTGHQLPYIGEVVMAVTEPRLIPAQANAGEADLQARGLNFSDIAILKKGERRSGYRTLLWPEGAAAHFALYPNLNVEDPVWRGLLRDVRFRRALSLGIDRHIINNALYFGLGREGNNAVLKSSPLYKERFVKLNATFDPGKANRLLDELGLIRKGRQGMRLLPDGRKLELIVETAGEKPEDVEILELIGETWRDIGVKLFIRPSERSLMRNRAYAGKALMTVWGGWGNGIPTPQMPPDQLAPIDQADLVWPKWGQFYQTKGESGEPVNMPQARKLLDLYDDWLRAANDSVRRSAWEQMLKIHAEQQFIIGVIAEISQPVVVSTRLRNVPDRAVWSWDPGAHFGIYRPDQFWFADTDSNDTDAARGKAGKG